MAQKLDLYQLRLITEAMIDFSMGLILLTMSLALPVIFFLFLVWLFIGVQQ